MPKPDDKFEQRGWQVALSTRADGDDPETPPARVLTGYAAVFNDETDIGGFFREKIEPGAFTEALARDDVRALIEHDPLQIVARSSAGNLRLTQDERGLAVEIDPPNTPRGQQLVADIEAGLLREMSFAFTVVREEWDETVDPPLRTILEIGELRDVAIVAYPAYATTEIALRSRPGTRGVDDHARRTRERRLALLKLGGAGRGQREQAE